MAVVVVESPAKAKTINKYLGKDFVVLASYGHVRDLPPKDGSVLPDEDFAMSWKQDSKSAKRVKDIADALKGDDQLILATDPDREGEAISWHVLELLKKKKALKDIAVKRVVFNAITKKSVLDAMENPREVDMALVDAYLARRALDYLVGFTLSPVLWRKLPSARSAGRVQSVALRLVCARELEIESFNSKEYWTIQADLKTGDGKPYSAKLWSIEGKKLDKFDINNEKDAKAVETALKNIPLTIESVESKPVRRNPSAPFTTSTLQQEASRKLGFSARETMGVAQKLYEGFTIDGENVGLITYMRTDGVSMDGSAIAAARNVIQQKYGEPFVPATPRVYKTKAKNAQEAHEAIRPTELSRTPEEVRSILDKSHFALYELVWKRAIASQMESATIEQTSANIGGTGNDDKKYSLRATGSVIRFEGFLKVYQEGRDDSKREDDKRLPALSTGDKAGVEKIAGSQHFTEPPPRYSEASLIKKMEELGIGRPSTYTSVLTTLRERDYVRLEKKRLIPEDKGRLVTAFLESFFTRYVGYDFTADLEEKLDKVSAGEIEWKSVLHDFWTDFKAQVDEIKDVRVTAVLNALNDVLGPHIFPEKEDGTPPRKCPSCDDGQLSLKIGRFGAFIGCENYPECRFTRPLGNGKDDGAAAVPAEGILLGHHPETQQPITRHAGRFGPYVQLGVAEDGEKPPRSSLPKGIDPESVDLELAIKLLSLPRRVGEHPETGKEITAGLGRYGPFVLHDRTYANLENFEEIFTVGLNRAVTVLAEKKANSRKSSSELRDLGEHPDGDGTVKIMDGRYGPYAKYGKINATLPKDVDPNDVTMEMAVELIAARAAKKKPAKKKAAKKKAAKKPAKKAAKKPAKKKAAAKKPAARK
jgi:DNA topoisomerase-1